MNLKKHLRKKQKDVFRHLYVRFGIPPFLLVGLSHLDFTPLGVFKR